MERILIEKMIEKSELSINVHGYGTHVKDLRALRNISDFDILYTLSGEYDLTINGKKHRSIPGDLILIPPSSLLVISTVKDSTHFYCHFSLEYNGTNLSSRFCEYALPKKFMSLKLLFSQCFEKFIQNGDLAFPLRSVCKMILAEMIFLNERHYCEFLRRQSPAKELDPAIRYIHDHIQEPIRNKKLAEIMGFNPSYFSRYFKKLTGQSPNEYMVSVKMEFAKRLLYETDASIAEIAEKLGYSDQFVFSKAFKKSCGFAPIKYRKSVIL